MSSVNVLVCLVFACCLAVVSCNGPLCYMCSKIRRSQDCDRIVQCAQNEICHTQMLIGSTSRAYYTMGCLDKGICARNSFSIIGKRDSTMAGLPKRQASDHLLSLKCCEGNECNDNLFETNSTTHLKRCFHCDKVESPESCDSVVECGHDHLCYVHRGLNSLTFGYRYDMGCMPARTCDAAKHAFLQNSGCFVCCNKDYCNYNACDNYTASADTTTTTRTVKTSTAAGHIDGAPTITISPGPTVQAQYLQGVHVKCTSDTGVTIKWAFNGTDSLPRYVRAGSRGDLWIDRLDETNAGVYRCVWISRTGQLSFKDITVGITETPAIALSITRTPSGHLTPNQALSLRCNVIGNPVPSVTWTYADKNGVSSILGITYSDSRRVMTFDHYQPHLQDGTYTCTATNKLGRSSAFAYVP